MNRENPAEFPASSSGYSAEELLRHKDFDEMTWSETEQVRRLLEQAPWRGAERGTPRLRPPPAGRLDLRRPARHPIPPRGGLVTPFWRKPLGRGRPPLPS